MRYLRRWLMTLGSLAFVVLPMLAAGCAENQATSSDPPASGKSTAASEDDLEDLGELGDLTDLSEDLGAPMEAGSGLTGLPEAGSGLTGLPEAGSGLTGLPEAGSGINALPDTEATPQ